MHCKNGFVNLRIVLSSESVHLEAFEQKCFTQAPDFSPGLLLDGQAFYYHGNAGL